MLNLVEHPPLSALWSHIEWKSIPLDGFHDTGPSANPLNLMSDI